MVSSVQLLSHVRLFVTPWAAAGQASLSITNSRSLPRLMSIKLVMPSNHLILCCPLLLLPSIFSSIRVLSNESALHIRWPKYWSLSTSPSNEYSGLISVRIDWNEWFLISQKSDFRICCFSFLKKCKLSQEVASKLIQLLLPDTPLLMEWWLSVGGSF